MKLLPVAFLFCLNSTIAYAIEPFATQKPVICSDVKTLVEHISGEDFQEQPFWTGKDTKSRYVLFVNQKKKTWTIVQFNDQVACMIGSGDDPNMLNLGKTVRQGMM